MIEKLIENWLDSASERSYQPSFVQMLNAKGYQVLHSTRHCSLEYGKDVIAIAPDGTPCAYQLKGNPSSRLGLKEFRSEIQPQLIQLTSQAIVFPGLRSDKPHRSYLVTNGYFEEEVQRAVDDMNRTGSYSQIHLLSRGNLLDWARELGAALWPSELRNVQALLALFMHDGADLLPLGRLAELLEDMLKVKLEQEPLADAELQRAIPSAALMTGIATRSFSAKENHYAMSAAWCLYLTYGIAACLRSGRPIGKHALSSFSLAEQAIKDSLVALWIEIRDRAHEVEGNALADYEIFRWRYTLLSGLMSILWFFPGDSDEDKSRRVDVANWLRQRKKYFDLWGEGAVPSLLAFFLCKRRIDATIQPDFDLAALMAAVIERNQRRSKIPLPDPYYSFEDVARTRYTLRANPTSSQLQEESFDGSSYMAELLLLLVARARLKNSCRTNWADFTRLIHKYFLPSSDWEFCLLRAERGDDVGKQYPSTYEWTQLCGDADPKNRSCEYLPAWLGERPHLLLLWVVLVPHRLTTDIGLILANTLRPH